MGKFTKQNDNRFIFEASEQDASYIDDALRIVDGDISYEEYITYEVYQTLLSRYVGRCFLQSEYATDLSLNGFVVIDVMIGGNVITVSLGEIPLSKDTKKLVVGVLNN